MKKTLPRGVIAATACALVAAGQASAATQVRNMTQIGASMCTLSIPSIDTKVRPKAIGYGNEGTASAFVICSFGSPPGGQVSTSDFSVVRLLLKSMDGATHNVTCTAVNSAADGGTVGLPAPQYVSKTIAVSSIMVGLSLALKATAVGLLVAIPCVVMNNVLRRRVIELITLYKLQQQHGS